MKVVFEIFNSKSFLINDKFIEQFKLTTQIIIDDIYQNFNNYKSKYDGKSENNCSERTNGDSLVEFESHEKSV